MVGPGATGSEGQGQLEPRAVRLLNTFLAIGLIAVLAALAITKEVLGEDLLPSDVRWILRLVAFVALLGVLAGIAFLWRRVQPGDVQARLRTHLLTSFLSEAAAIIGAIFWFMTGDALILVGVTGPAMLVLSLSRPRDEGTR